MKAKTCTTVLSLGVSSFITQFAITIVMALTNNLLVSYGALSIYGSEIPMTATGIVMKVNQILISILVGILVSPWVHSLSLVLTTVPKILLV